jgi:hypothetical protein
MNCVYRFMWMLFPFTQLTCRQSALDMQFRASVNRKPSRVCHRLECATGPSPANLVSPIRDRSQSAEASQAGASKGVARARTGDCHPCGQQRGGNWGRVCLDPGCGPLSRGAEDATSLATLPSRTTDLGGAHSARGQIVNAVSLTARRERGRQLHDLGWRHIFHASNGGRCLTQQREPGHSTHLLGASCRS